MPVKKQVTVEDFDFYYIKIAPKDMTIAWLSITPNCVPLLIKLPD